MNRIRIQDAADGMVLGTAVADTRGKTVFEPGTRLDDAAISRIFELGVTELDIEPDDGGHTVSAEVYERYGVTNDAELEARIDEIITRRFRLSPESDEIMMDLRRIARKLEFRRAGLGQRNDT